LGLITFNRKSYSYKQDKDENVKLIGRALSIYLDSYYARIVECKKLKIWMRERELSY
jgi:hypothetical protein